MSQQNPLLDVLAQRRLLALEVVEHLMRERLVDSSHAVRPLRMPRAGVVFNE